MIATTRMRALSFFRLSLALAMAFPVLSGAWAPKSQFRPSFWFPDSVPVLRGLVIQLLGGNQVYDANWQAWARRNRFGLVGYYNPVVPFSLFYDSSTCAPIDSLLDYLANQYTMAEPRQYPHHPEVVNLPLCAYGGSRGGFWSRDIAVYRPGRTIATAGWVAGIPPTNDSATAKVPGLFMPGEKDPTLTNYLKDIQQSLVPNRRKGALWTVAVMWGKEHETGPSENLIRAYFDRVIAYRVPADWDATKGPAPLRDYREADGWVGDLSTWSDPSAAILPDTAFHGDAGLTSWMPDRYLAAVWRGFVSKQPILAVANPRKDTVWPCPCLIPSPVTLAATRLRAVPLKAMRFYDGDSLLADLPGDSLSRAGVALPEGLHSFMAAAVDTAGVEYPSVPSTVWIGGPGAARLGNRSATPAAGYALRELGPGGKRQLAFDLPRAGRYRLRLLDPRGREVAVLADRAFASGPHRLELPAGARGPLCAELSARGGGSAPAFLPLAGDPRP